MSIIPNKTCLITHNDMDGAGCSILLERACGDSINYVIKTGYGRITRAIERAATVSDNVIITDLNLTQQQVDLVNSSFKYKLLIDHHSASESDAIPFPSIINMKYCATYITAAWLRSKGYTLTSDMKFMVKVINDYDLFKLDVEESLLYNELFWEHRFWKFVSMFKYGFNAKLNDYLLDEGRVLLDQRFERIRTYPNIVADNTRYTFTDSDVSEIPLVYPEFDFHMIIRSPRLVSVRSKQIDLTPFYDAVRRDFDVDNVGGHAHAGGIAFMRDYNDDMEDVMSVFFQFTQGELNE